MERVTEETLHLFTSGEREIVLMDGKDHYRYQFLSSIPDCDGHYLVAMSMRNRLPVRLHIPSIVEEYTHYYFYDDLNDIYRKKIEWHKSQIKNLEEYIERETNAKMTWHRD